MYEYWKFFLFINEQREPHCFETFSLDKILPTADFFENCMVKVGTALAVTFCRCSAMSW